MTLQTIPEYAQQLLDEQVYIEKKLSECENIIKEAPKGTMGLTLDSAKTPEWKEAKGLYARYWDRYRLINQRLNKVRQAVGYEVVNGKRVTIYQYKTV